MTLLFVGRGGGSSESRPNLRILANMSSSRNRTSTDSTTLIGMSGAGQVAALPPKRGAGTVAEVAAARDTSISEMAGESPSDRDSIGSAW